MSALLASFITLAGMAVGLSVAPDQPFRHVYVDDPLILELTSDVDADAKVMLEVRPDFATAREYARPPAEPLVLDLGPFPLRAHGAYWTTVDGIPVERGRYRLHARIDIDGTVTETNASFCRIDRPSPAGTAPLCAMLSDVQARSAWALKQVAVKSVGLSADLPDVAAKVEELSAMDFQVTLVLEGRLEKVCQSLAKSCGDKVACWDVDAGKTPEQIAAIAKALRQGESKAPVALVVDNAQTLAAALNAGMGPFFQRVVFRADAPRPNDLAALRKAAEKAGYEDLPISVRLASGKPEDAEQGPRLARQILTHLSVDVMQTEVDAALLCGDEAGPAYPYASALAQRLINAIYVGPLAISGGVQALKFRTGESWLMAVWTTDAPKDVSLKLENATGVALFDARNNPLPAPALHDGSITLHAVHEPLFLTGQGGATLVQAARATMHKAASSIADAEDIRKRLPPDMMDIVKRFTGTDANAYARLDFLNLLKLFPRIEELWHSGKLPRSVAVPALAGIARLAKAVCVAEQDRGEAFVEPLRTTLANCGQFQSLYLTGSAGGSETHERPDWIYGEVGRLMDQADKLSAEGRAIEAGGIAALAEWRARALEIAAKAQPLSVPEKEELSAEIAPSATHAPEKDDKSNEAANGLKPDVSDRNKAVKTDAGTENPNKREAEAQEITHVVVKGDNPGSIAKRYKVKLDDLCKWNGWKKNVGLHIGQKVIIRP